MSEGGPKISREVLGVCRSLEGEGGFRLVCPHQVFFVSHRVSCSHITLYFYSKNGIANSVRRNVVRVSMDHFVEIR